MSLKVLVNIADPQDSKRLIVICAATLLVSELKRRIEREYSELFPYSPPLICVKLEDQFGYALSNSSCLAEILPEEPRVTAIPDERAGSSLKGNAQDLTSLLLNVQQSVLGKLLDSEMSVPAECLVTVLPLLFSLSVNVLKLAGTVVGRVLCEDPQVLVSRAVCKQLSLALTVWVDDYVEEHSELKELLVSLLEAAVQSESFCYYYRTEYNVNRLMTLGDSLSHTGKGKLSRVVYTLNSKDHYRAPVRTPEHSNPTLNNEAESIKEYILLITPQVTKEVLVFSLNGLSGFSNSAINSAVSSPDLMRSLFNLVDLVSPAETHQMHYELLITLARKLDPTLAGDLLHRGGAVRVLKAYAEHSLSVQPALLVLLEKLLSASKESLDFISVFALCRSPEVALSELGIEALSVLAAPQFTNIKDIEFGQNLRFLLQAATSETFPLEYKQHVVECLANLCLRPALVHSILNCGGVRVLAHLLRDTANINMARTAAKALSNLCLSDEQASVPVVSALSEDIRKLYKNELDSIVSAHLQRLLNKKSHLTNPGS